MPVAVGAPAPGQERERIAGVAAEVARPVEADSPEEEQRQDERLTTGRRPVVAPAVVRGERRGQGGGQRRDQAGLRRSGQEQEAARAFAPAVVRRFPRRWGWRIFPPRPGGAG